MTQHDLVERLRECVSRYERTVGFYGSSAHLDMMREAADALEQTNTPPQSDLQRKLDMAVEALEKIYRAYVNTLESGRDRIMFLGGECDSVERMEEGDPALILARSTLLAIKDTPTNG